ncbi:unnamed protein product, partial [Rotaria sp. Silwood1]
SLLELSLYDNPIGDIGAQYLADALKANETLKYLSLSGTQIGDNGIQHLALALRDNKTLDRVFLPKNISEDIRNNLVKQDHRLLFV